MKGLFRAAFAAVLLCLASYAPAGAFAPNGYVQLPKTESATAALDAAAAAACADPQNRTIRLPAGNYRFLTAPQPFPCALNIVAEGRGTTNLIRDYQGGAFLKWERGTDQSGGSIRRVALLAGNGTSGGIALLIEAVPDTDPNVNSFNRHNFVIDEVLVGRESPAANTSWSFGIYLDGWRNPDNENGIAPGIRGTHIEKTTVSGTTTSQFYLNKARGVYMNVECYIPLGGFHGILMEYITQGVTIYTRSCPQTSYDQTVSSVMRNGQIVIP